MSTQETNTDLAKKLGTISWGIFLVWLGVLFVGELSTGIGLLGIGAITLGTQAVRLFMGLPHEGFWVVVGLLFLAAGAWEFLNPSLPLITVVLVLAGVAVIRSALRAAS